MYTYIDVYIAIYMYKVKNQLPPRSVEEIFTKKQSCYSLRNSDFVTPRFKTISYCKHSLRYLGPVVWSKLTSSVRKSPTLKHFKTKVRKYDINSLLENNCSSCELCRS